MRIPYIYEGNIHSYIVDFIDIKNQKVYEIKPKSETFKNKNIIKENALIEWSKKNNFEYVKINEDYFKNILFDLLIFEGKVKEIDKLKKFKIYFKNEN